MEAAKSSTSIASLCSLDKWRASQNSRSPLQCLYLYWRSLGHGVGYCGAAMASVIGIKSISPRRSLEVTVEPRGEMINGRGPLCVEQTIKDLWGRLELSGVKPPPAPGDGTAVKQRIQRGSDASSTVPTGNQLLPQCGISAPTLWQTRATLMQVMWLCNAAL